MPQILVCDKWLLRASSVPSCNPTRDLRNFLAPKLLQARSVSSSPEGSLNTFAVGLAFLPLRGPERQGHLACTPCCFYEEYCENTVHLLRSDVLATLFLPTLRTKTRMHCTVFCAPTEIKAQSIMCLPQPALAYSVPNNAAAAFAETWGAVSQINFLPKF